jgi:cold shock protein
MNGTVKFCNAAKGFRFIESDDRWQGRIRSRERARGRGHSYAQRRRDRVSFVLEDDRKGRGKQAAQPKKI